MKLNLIDLLGEPEPEVEGAGEETRFVFITKSGRMIDTAENEYEGWRWGSCKPEPIRLAERIEFWNPGKDVLPFGV